MSKNFSKPFPYTVGGVREVILISGQNQTCPFLKTDSLKGTFITQHQRGGRYTAPPFRQNMITYAETKKKSIFWKNCTLYRENKNQIKTHFRWKKQEISLKIKLQGAPTCGFG